MLAKVPNTAKGESRSRKLVVAGLVVDGERILITQRRADQPMPLKWEFPGGKIEAGESPTRALRRELREEIGAAVELGGIWEVLYHSYPEFDLLMLIYPCRLVGDAAAQCCEVADLAWVLPSEMQSYDILEADAPLVDRLVAEGIPGLSSASSEDFD
jgi:8-oxo-dGTP diphosphatase